MTCGADEALFLVASAYLGPGRVGVVADPSFSMFRVVSEGVGGSLVTVAVDADWHLPLEPRAAGCPRPERRRRVAVQSEQSHRTRACRRLRAHGARRSCRTWRSPSTRRTAEISGDTPSPTTCSERRTAILIRTFSKGYGLAGARVGYVVTSEESRATLETLRLPQNMTAFGIAAACRALEDQAGSKSAWPRSWRSGRASRPSCASAAGNWSPRRPIFCSAARRDRLSTSPRGCRERA